MTETPKQRRNRLRERHRTLLRGVPDSWLERAEVPSADPSIATEDELRQVAETLLERQVVLDFLTAHSRRAAVAAARDVIHSVPSSREANGLAVELLGSVGHEPPVPEEYTDDGTAFRAFVVVALAADAVADDRIANNASR